MKIQTNFSFLPKINLLAPKSKDKKKFFNIENDNRQLYDIFLSLRIDKP